MYFHKADASRNLGGALTSFQSTAQHIGDTVNTLDHGVILVGHRQDMEIKDMKSKDKKIKNKNIKNKKNMKKNMKNKDKKKRMKKCNAIKELEIENKIKCAFDCSNYYLKCDNGHVIEESLKLNERCYENKIVLTTEGKCVLRDASDMVMSFEVMDGCTNYPELEFCSTAVGEGKPPYKGVLNVEGTWSWIDNVVVTYFASNDEETGVRTCRLEHCHFFVTTSYRLLICFQFRSEISTFHFI